LDGKLRIAIAGTGFGEKYALGLRALPEVEVIGVYSRRPERAAAMAERFAIPYSTRHLHVLLDLPDLHALAVVTPNSTHAEFVRAALDAHLHVICDKPLALTGAEGAELAALAEAAGVRHVTFVPYRFSPAALAVKAALEQAHLGRIVSARANWGVDLRAEPLRWRFQGTLSGPGVVADLGAHVLDLLTWWLGPIRRVLGRCRTLVAQRPAEAGGRMRPVDVPDECWALLEFAGAGVGSVSLSWNEKRDQRIEIQGERGSLVYESPSLLQWLTGQGPFRPTATLVSGGRSARHTPLPLPGLHDFAAPEAGLTRMFRDIVAHLRAGEKTDSVATFHDGAGVLQVMDAIVASNQAGGWLEVAAPPPPAAEASA